MVHVSPVAFKAGLRELAGKAYRRRNRCWYDVGAITNADGCTLSRLVGLMVGLGAIKLPAREINCALGGPAGQARLRVRAW